MVSCTVLLYCTQIILLNPPLGSCGHLQQYSQFLTISDDTHHLDCRFWQLQTPLGFDPNQFTSRQAQESDWQRTHGFSLPACSSQVFRVVPKVRILTSQDMFVKSTYLLVRSKVELVKSTRFPRFWWTPLELHIQHRRCRDQNLLNMAPWVRAPCTPARGGCWMQGGGNIPRIEVP